MPVNAWSLGEGVKPSINVTFGSGSGPPTWTMGSGDAARPVQLGIAGQRKTRPHMFDSALLEAAPWMRGRQPTLIARGEDDKRILLHVRAQHLDFGFKKMMGDVYWPGGESLARPWLQSGGDNDRAKEQLFVLHPGSFIYAIDIHGAVARVDSGSPPKFSPAIADEFAQYVQAYVLIKFAKPNRVATSKRWDMTWGVKTLRALGQSGLATNLIDRWNAYRATCAEAAAMDIR